MTTRVSGIRISSAQVTYRWISSLRRAASCCPRKYPIDVRMAHQIAAPTPVYRMNFGSGMRCSPAGIDTRWRTTGNSRPISVLISVLGKKAFGAQQVLFAQQDVLAVALDEG